VIAGPPNSGKSTLLNRLVGRDAAIVSPISGTTRDRIEAPVVRDGIAYVLTDTAGLAAETFDPIELIGIARAEDAMTGADILLWLDDTPSADERAIWVHARADIAGRETAPAGAIAISAASGVGIDALWSVLRERSAQLLPREDGTALNRRQRSLAEACATAVQSAAAQQDLLLVAEELRLAMAALDALVGRSDVEAMLDALFRRFCLGK
jgi:tRNA modification GTPase